ncbi:Flavin prenyltransferase PAD1, mitochondrial [Lachnellula hyalina]|uniref:Flavin prenyltransferase PAD1, mitochondrial n=1 Tax=Lachnellula hyalina TaxID=1316788 RepID=A0A8H8QYI2_9HELO|nr:Flavin prenyltransferase PAD1, mitochondrial [Lachnellula hyalina]TVY24090.1 Flavin prenyltransferase PAD1, mitochondrial [Lachnellula hyalina]
MFCSVSKRRISSSSSYSCSLMSRTSFESSKSRRTYASTPDHRPLARRKRIIVAMTGATGAILGIKVLEALRRMNVETHLIVSKWADATIKYETDYAPATVRELADFAYTANNLAAPVSSGSFHTDGMIVVPCSMKSLAGIRTGYCSDLIARAADVILKERRKLVMVVRETPLSDIHLENMLSLTRSGAIMFPPVPAFYTRPDSVDDIIQQSVGRMLDMFDLDTGDFERWEGMKQK